MSRLPVATPKEVLRALQRPGFFIHHSTGSHHILKHTDKPGLRVTVAVHNRELKRRTLATIIEQTGYTVEEFRSPRL